MFFLKNYSWVDVQPGSPFPPVRAYWSKPDSWSVAGRQVFAPGTAVIFLCTVRRDERCEAEDKTVKKMWGGNPHGACTRREYPVFLIDGARYLFPQLDCLVHSSDPEAEALVSPP
jgi:hypothetical protein